MSAAELAPIPMRIPCPSCATLHIDEGAFATKPHHTHEPALGEGTDDTAAKK